jgi:outer membrane protein OmpA-like peptidoglycan-associated protein
MNRAICASLGAVLATGSLSGCFFGLLDVQRDPSTPPAPVVDATVKVVHSSQAPGRRSGPLPPSAAAQVARPIAVAPAAQAGQPGARGSPASDIVRFSVDEYRPAPTFDASLRAHAKQLKADPSLHLLLKGYGDGRGTVHYNRALAAKRAEVVAKVLLGYGVAARQLTQVVGDDDDPHSPDTRRVELIYR